MENQTIVNASNAAQALAKIGTRTEERARWLARLISYLQSALSAFEQAKEVLVAGHTKIDDEGAPMTIVVKVNGKENSQPVLEDPGAFQEEMGKLLRQPVSVEGKPPKPITWEDFVSDFKWGKEKPMDSVLAAALGPFIDLGDEEEGEK